MVRIFVTGCARSGTTLLGRLFYAFEGVEIIDAEVNIDDFCALTSHKAFLIAKRSPCTILSVPLPEEEIERQVSLVTSHGIRVVNIIRDGRDVVHRNPTGPQVNVNRWIGCILQAQKLRKFVSIGIRYEDLVRDPDAVQEGLSETLHLRSVARFSEYPAFVPERAFDEPEYRNLIYYRKRAIEQTSIGHSATEYLSMCTSTEEQALFERVLSRLGYAGACAGIWDMETLAREHELFCRLSVELGYNCS